VAEWFVVEGVYSVGVCADCGFAERSWSCGNQILVKKPNVVGYALAWRVEKNKKVT
jgi:hypothetical protein